MSVLGDFFQTSNTTHDAAGSIWVPLLKYGAVGLVTYFVYHQLIVVVYFIKVSFILYIYK